MLRSCNFQLIHIFFFCSARELFQRAGGLFPSLPFFHCDIFVFTQQHLDLEMFNKNPDKEDYAETATAGEGGGGGGLECHCFGS